MPDPTRAVLLAPGVYRIPTAPFDLVNTFALVDDAGAVTLIDAGWRRAPARVLAGLAAIDKAPADVVGIVLTHAHPDHAGGLAGLAEQTGAPCRPTNATRSTYAPAERPAGTRLPGPADS